MVERYLCRALSTCALRILHCVFTLPCHWVQLWTVHCGFHVHNATVCSLGSRCTVFSLRNESLMAISCKLSAAGWWMVSSQPPLWLKLAGWKLTLVQSLVGDGFACTIFGWRLNCLHNILLDTALQGASLNSSWRFWNGVCKSLHLRVLCCWI